MSDTRSAELINCTDLRMFVAKSLGWQPKGAECSSAWLDTDIGRNKYSHGGLSILESERLF